MRLNSVEICAGAGGQALGLEAAGFRHLALVEYDAHACRTLRLNRPKWKVIEKDLRAVDASELTIVNQPLHLLAGGIPCPPFSVAGKQLGRNDERDLFPEVLRLVEQLKPRALLIENVKGLMSKRFDAYRAEISATLAGLGLQVVAWEVLEASRYGVPQRRPRSVLVALDASAVSHFEMPEGQGSAPSVGQALAPHLTHWHGAQAWASKANEVAPTLVGGSRKHGGADLGPTGAKAAWLRLDVNGKLLADAPPASDYQGPLTLTVEHAAVLQGFPIDWEFQGGKTARYRQVGNAFPPPVAKAIGTAIAEAVRRSSP